MTTTSGIRYGAPPTYDEATGGARPTAPAAEYDYGANYGSVSLYIEPKPEFGFDDRSIRRSFVRKVFSIIFVQLLIFVGVICWFLFEPSTNNYVIRHQWIYWASYIVFLVAYLCIVCCENLRRSFPGNYVCLLLLTVGLSMVAASLSCQLNNNRAVLMAMAICAVCCLSVAIFSIQTKIDFTKYIGVVASVGLAIAWFGIFAILFTVIFHVISIVYLVYAGLAAVLFMAYLAIDIQMLMGGRREDIHPEEYIFAATQIFVDVAMIFIYLLILIASCQRK